ncbi:hypothetical protein GS393_00024 [Pseudomonas savastanoi pv. phaseolicola]|nr:hypothetical protein [Pseudomonas savastanoi pv. phaseolicola]
MVHRLFVPDAPIPGQMLNVGHKTFYISINKNLWIYVIAASETTLYSALGLGKNLFLMLLLLPLNLRGNGSVHAFQCTLRIIKLVFIDFSDL